MPLPVVAVCADLWPVDAEANRQQASFRELFQPAMRLVLTIGIVVVDRLIPETQLDADMPLADMADEVGAIDRMAAGDVSSVSPPENSVAVLPFVNMSSDAEQEYFSDGLSEELLDGIDRIFLVACGTSWHAGLIGKHLIETAPSGCSRDPGAQMYGFEHEFRWPTRVRRTYNLISVTANGHSG